MSGSSVSFYRRSGTIARCPVHDASEVGCSGCVDKVLLKLRDELVAPNCTGVVEVQVRYGLGLNAPLADISRSAASAFSNADW